MNQSEIDKLPELLTVEQARHIVGIGLGKMYELIRTEKDLPVIKLSPRQTRVIKSDFLNWIKSKYQH